MQVLANILTSIVLVFIALGLVSAVMVSRPREPRAGRRLNGPAGRPAFDPHFYPYGDMPGFSREQLEAIARRPVELHHGLDYLELTYGEGGRSRRVALDEPFTDGELLRRSAAGSGAVSSRPMPLPANDVKRTERQFAQGLSRQLFSAPAPKPPFGRGRREF